MKTKLFLLLTLLITTATSAQINLVPNPSFEDTVYCPFGTNQIDACANWLNFGNSPDYFNTCTGFGGPPINYNFGYQFPHTGNAMAGLATYRRPNSPSGPNYREFIGTQLSTPLVIGIKYYISLYVNSSNKLEIATNKLGLNLSTIAFDSCCKPPLNNSAFVFSDSILKDSVSWIRLESSFIADSAYEYVVIGNLFNDQNTDTLLLSSLYDAAYYYIDDVCVTTDSIYNQSWTGLIKNNSKSEINVFPNPTNEKVNIESKEVFNEISLVNYTGQTLFQEHFQFKSSYSFELPFSIQCGLYMLKVKHKNSVSIYKLLIQF